MFHAVMRKKYGRGCLIGIKIQELKISMLFVPEDEVPMARSRSGMFFSMWGYNKLRLVYKWDCCRQSVANSGWKMGKAPLRV